MADWPIRDTTTHAQSFAYGWTTSNQDARPDTQGGIMTVPSANTKGDWTEFVGVGDLDFDAHGFWVDIASVAGDSSYMLDIGFGDGGASTTTVVLPDFFFQGLTMITAFDTFIPLPIPAGTGVYGRIQSDGRSSYCYGSLRACGQGFAPGPLLGTAESVGTNSSKTAAVAMDPGTTTNTKGDWSELTAASTYPSSMLTLFIGTRADTAVDTASWFIDIGIGGAGSEQVIIPDLFYNVVSSTDFSCQIVFGPYPFHFPAGTRIAVRGQCNNRRPDRRLDVAGMLYC